MTTSLKQIIPLSLALLVLLGYQFIGASTWTDAPASPPLGNAPVPINVGVNSASDQELSGTLRAHNLFATTSMNSKTALYDNALAVGVYNTSVSPSALTAWRVLRNDGTGNFLTYINTAGGNSPTYETNGHAYRESYNVGNGIYNFQTANAAGTTGGAISWENNFRVMPGGKVGATQYCDIDGNNCSSIPGGGATGKPIAEMMRDTGNPVPTPPSGISEWPDFLICRDGGNYRDFTVVLSEIRDASGNYIIYDVPYADAVIRKVFNPNGTHHTNSVVAANCGSSGTDIASICADGRCGYFGGANVTAVAGAVLPTCSVGQVLKVASGGNWVCAEDANDAGGVSCVSNIGDSCGCSGFGVVLCDGTCSGPTDAATCRGSCFTAETMVLMADGGTMPIHEIAVGDQVRGQNGAVHTVLGLDHPLLWEGKNQHLIEINGDTAFTTDNHPIMTTDGWKALNPAMAELEAYDQLSGNVGQLEIGDEIVTENGTIVVESIEVLPQEAEDKRLYNLLLDGDHTYYANGMLVHGSVPDKDGRYPLANQHDGEPAE